MRQPESKCDVYSTYKQRVGQVSSNRASVVILASALAWMWIQQMTRCWLQAGASAAWREIASRYSYEWCKSEVAAARLDNGQDDLVRFCFGRGAASGSGFWFPRIRSRREVNGAMERGVTAKTCKHSQSFSEVFRGLQGLWEWDFYKLKWSRKCWTSGDWDQDLAAPTIRSNKSLA